MKLALLIFWVVILTLVLLDIVIPTVKSAAMLGCFAMMQAIIATKTE